MKCRRVRGETRYIRDRRPWGEVYNDDADDTMSETNDFAVSFVSLVSGSAFHWRVDRA